MVGVAAAAKGTVEPGPLDASLQLADQVVELDSHMREALQISKNEAPNIGNRLGERIGMPGRDASDRDTGLRSDLEFVAKGRVRVTSWSVAMILASTVLFTVAGYRYMAR